MAVRLMTGSNFINAIENVSGNETSEKYVQLCAYVLYNGGYYESAKSYFDVLIELTPAESLIWKLLSAHCNHATGDETAAMCLMNEVRKK